MVIPLGLWPAGKAGGTWAWPHLRPGGTVVDPILREVPAAPFSHPLGRLEEASSSRASSAPAGARRGGREKGASRAWDWASSSPGDHQPPAVFGCRPSLGPGASLVGKPAGPRTQGEGGGGAFNGVPGAVVSVGVCPCLLFAVRSERGSD